MTLNEIEKFRNAKKLEVGERIKAAVEAICRDVELTDEVLPIVNLANSPQEVYGGHPRKVTAHVTVDFLLPSCRPFQSCVTTKY
jgi:hypothetical protein